SFSPDHPHTPGLPSFPTRRSSDLGNDCGKAGADVGASAHPPVSARSHEVLATAAKAVTFGELRQRSTIPSSSNNKGKAMHPTDKAARIAGAQYYDTVSKIAFPALSLHDAEGS